MKKQIYSWAIALLTIGSSLSLTNIALADEITCQGTLGAITVDNVKVPQGKTCTLNGTTVKGNIVVNRNSTLKANGAKVIEILSRFPSYEVSVDFMGFCLGLE